MTKDQTGYLILSLLFLFLGPFIGFGVRSAVIRAFTKKGGRQ